MDSNSCIIDDFPEKSTTSKRTFELKLNRKLMVLVKFDPSKSEKCLTDNMQHSWWLTESHASLNTKFKVGVTCEMYRKLLIEKSIGVNPPPVCTISEWCLMREIVWMLQIEPEMNITTATKSKKKQMSPKCFTIDAERSEITLKPNVSLASVTVEGIQLILCEFATNMTILYRFRQFFKPIFQPNDNNKNNAISENEKCSEPPPHSIVCYAYGLKEFIHAITCVLVNKELELIKQNPIQILSIVKLYNDLLPHFRQLQQLNDIHCSCYLDLSNCDGMINKLSFNKL